MVNPNVLGSFWRVVREINPAAIVEEAERSFCILICGQPSVGKNTLRGALSASQWPSAATLPYLRVVDGVPEETFGASLALYVVDASRGLYHDDFRAARALAARGVPLICVFNKVDLAPDDPAFLKAARELGLTVADRVAFVKAIDADQVRDSLVPMMLAAAPELRVAMGRRIRLVRDPAAARIVEEASRVNAELALISSVPASIPIVGIGAVGADMVVMTKNQAMMLFKLAAIYGRSLDSKPRLLLEIAPVVGAAFLWRTAARTAVSLLPGLVAAAPKALIAYVGTYLVGMAAQHYYRWGHRPSREALARYAREARAKALRLIPRVQLPSRSDLRGLLERGREDSGQAPGERRPRSDREPPSGEGTG